MRDQLHVFHGATKLQNIPEIASSALYQNLMGTIQVSLNQTVSEVLKKINDTLSLESVILQFKKFQEQKHKKAIISTQRLPENQRIVFYQSKNLHECLQIAFSPREYYFTITPASFKK